MSRILIILCVKYPMCGLTFYTIQHINRLLDMTMNSRETHGHGTKIVKQPSRLNLRKFSFSHRVVDDRNSSLSKVVEARAG